jgi:hypothetical protein
VSISSTTGIQYPFYFSPVGSANQTGDTPANNPPPPPPPSPPTTGGAGGQNGGGTPAPNNALGPNKVNKTV